MLEPRRIQLLPASDKGKVRKNVEFTPSNRYNINLVEPGDLGGSEFSYVDLLDGKNDEKHTSDDPYAQEDQEEIEKLQRIADSFNAKYGSAKKSKKRKRDIRDLVDVGEGYCEDSFVDNSEAYDEVVPWCLDTKHGGFYINEGLLDFIKNDDSVEIDAQPKKKKEKLDSDHDGAKKKTKTIDPKKQKLKKKFNPNTEGGSGADGNPRAPVPPSAPAVSNPETAIHVVQDRMDRSFAEEDASELEESFAKTESEDPTIAGMIESLACEIIQEVTNTRNANSTLTPGETQPSPVFSSVILEKLTRLHSLCQTRKLEEKRSVFERIAVACNCQKEQLYKKIKRYRMNGLMEKINKCKAELRELISKLMPGLIEKYNLDLAESNKLKGVKKVSTAAKESGDSDVGDEGKAETMEKAKRIMAPRRKFVWTSEIRNLLCELVSLKMRHFDMSKIKYQTAEEHLRLFLESDIRPLWPSGWILTRALYKESRPAHQNWTGDQTKPKKVGNPSTVNQPTPDYKPQVHQQTPQQHSTPSHKPQIVVKPQDEPIVINLVESDNESKMPSASSTPKQQNKNVFTLLKEKPNVDVGRSDPATLDAFDEHAPVAPQGAPPMKAQDGRECKGDGFNVSTSHANAVAPTTPVQQIRDQFVHPGSAQKSLSIGREPSAKFVPSVAPPVVENRSLPKQETVFVGKMVSVSKPFQTLTTPNTGLHVTNKCKTSPSPGTTSENYGNIFMGLHAVAPQLDLLGEVSQPQRKRTNSQTLPSHVATHAIMADSSAPHQTITQQQQQPVSKTETSPQKSSTENQNQVQKSMSGMWDASIYQQHIQQSPSTSQLYQQQLLQFQQQRQQMMKKCPKQEKQLTTQLIKNMSPASFTNLQHQQPCTSTSSMAPASKTPQHQLGSTAKCHPNEIFVQDHQQEASRGRPTEVANLQRGLQSPTSSSEHKINNLQKSPLRKDAPIAQQPGYLNFHHQNVSPQQKQQMHQGIALPMTQKSQQGILNQNAQQNFNARQIVAAATLQQMQAKNTTGQHNAGQQLHNVQQHFPQHFYQSQTPMHDGSSQQKN